MKSEGRVVSVLNRNEDELEVLSNLGFLNLSEEGESITEEYKTINEAGLKHKTVEETARKKLTVLRWVEEVTGNS